MSIKSKSVHIVESPFETQSKEMTLQMLKKIYTIEFIGGPFDGHLEMSDCRPIHLAVDVVFLVCENAMR